MDRVRTRESINEIEWAFDQLWPLWRSLTGPGVRATHDVLGELLPLRRLEIPSGARVFDWVVPKEWIPRSARLIDPQGGVVVDAAQNNLHLVNYSQAFSGELDWQDLQPHLYTLPSQPDAIPYVTSYYQPRWGLCLSDRQRQALPPGRYRVEIDAEHIDGSLTISEAVLPGSSPYEVLISTYTCHPSLASNELSGPLTAAFLYRRLAAEPARRLTYRFVFLPETIGSLTYLWLRGRHLMRRLVAGYVVTLLGREEPFAYKRSRQANSVADRAAELVLRNKQGDGAWVRDFAPDGSDERQYCSPAFDLPVGSITCASYTNYPEYHTSLDNKSLISFEKIREAVDVYQAVCILLDNNCRCFNLDGRGEPHLSRYGLYPTLGGNREQSEREAEILEASCWLLALSDGRADLLEVAARSGLKPDALIQAASVLQEKGLTTLLPAPTERMHQKPAPRPRWQSRNRQALRRA